MFRDSAKSTGYPLHTPVSPLTSPPVRHHVPSCFNWSLLAHKVLFKHSLVVRCLADLLELFFMLFWIVATNREVRTGCCVIRSLPPQNLSLSTSSLSFGIVFAHHRQVYVLSCKCCLLFIELRSLNVQFRVCDMSGNREIHFYRGGILSTHAHTHTHTHTLTHTHVWTYWQWIKWLLFIHSFIHSFGMRRMWRFLAILSSFFHSTPLCTFPCHNSPPTILPSSLTSSCHLFLGLPLNLAVPEFTYNILLGNSVSFRSLYTPQTNVIYLTLLSLLKYFF